MANVSLLSEELIEELSTKYLQAHAQFIGSGEVYIDGVDHFARAIEKAILQSEQVQSLRKDAERFNKIINMTRAERKESLFFDCDKDVIKAVDNIYENR